MSSKELHDIFKPYPRLELRQEAGGSFTQFRAYAPQLVSCYDEQSKKALTPSLLVLYWDKMPIGALSYLIQQNSYRKSPRDHYARIDLVIVPESYEGNGLSFLLVSCAQLFFLESLPHKIYSISCLAAHPAIAHVLKSYGFQPKGQNDKNFVEYEQVVSDENALKIKKSAIESACERAQVVHYRLRQEQE